MNKEVNRTFIDEMIRFLYYRNLISSPVYVFFSDDRELPDTYFYSYCRRNGIPDDYKEMIQLGRSSLCAGLAASLSQYEMKAPVRDYSPAQVRTLKRMYEQADAEETAQAMSSGRAWGPYDTPCRKAEMFEDIAVYAAYVFKGRDGGGLSYDAEDIYRIDSFSYMMFNIGITLHMKGNISGV